MSNMAMGSAGATDRVIALVLSGFIAAACAARPRQSTTQGAPSPAPPLSAQVLYESGRDDELINTVATMAPGSIQPEDRWFAAHSQLRLGRREEALRQLTSLKETSGTGAFQVAADVALALLDGNTDAIDQGRAAAAAYPTDPFVQYELGVAHAVRNDFAGAARAFDACIQAAPRFAYAYYQAGIVYNRLDRADLTVARFESFLRLAPQAPERPQVESVLRIVRRS